MGGMDSAVKTDRDPTVWRSMVISWSIMVENLDPRHILSSETARDRLLLVSDED